MFFFLQDNLRYYKEKAGFNFQDNLRHYREKAGFKKAKDFAEEIGVLYNTYKGYESQNKEPKYETLVKIADKLGITTDELLGVKQDNTRYFKQAGYNVEEKEDILYFSSRWQVTEDTPPHEFKIDRLEYDRVVEVLEDNHRKNIVDIITAMIRAREVKEDFEVLEDEQQE
ncbi:MAG: helix-turn-helix domain-containing protein [Selenomonadales bacterium]|nr:helix-turn-helix domain-containing protein [Selenomonadales bacterium]